MVSTPYLSSSHLEYFGHPGRGRQIDYFMFNLLQTLQLLAQYAFPRALQAFASENLEIRLRQWLG